MTALGAMHVEARCRSRSCSAFSSSICFSTSASLAGELAELLLQRRPSRPRPSRRSRFSVVQPLRQLLRPSCPCSLGARRARRRAPPRSRSGPGRRSPWCTGSRAWRGSRRRVRLRQLRPAARRPSAGSRRRSAAAAFCCASSCASLLRSTARAACSSCACVTCVSSCTNRRWVFFQSRSKSSQTIQMTDRNRNRLDAAKTTFRKSTL